MELLYIRQILEGDLSRFSYFVETYKDMAYAIAYRIMQHPEDAEDVVQDAFVKAFRSLSSFRQDAKFSTWFYKIVVNTALSRAKNRKIFKSFVPKEDISETAIHTIENTYHQLAQDERKVYINRALDALNEEDSLILTLYYLNENSLEEIQEITGIVKENVKMKLHRARKKMYIVLQKLLSTETRNLL